MDLKFWKRRPQLTCEWRSSREFECYGRVRRYDYLNENGKLTKVRTFCTPHLKERRADMPDGWSLVRSQD